ncbi:hypothetical protein [Pyramidobacter piscolens]|uniref:Uncharacterized protein n=1 Tax=Pyramidobacter piscolens W5455 TaxID=352165 RepID=A0ABM9ZYK9_9BACT|nr:hypothetical protein [Pyramidobacter piscolens]EFB92007.1 hypothetical protein HMPREF7215_0473 [Pyramidobacter piscolens W5455]BDF78716.1 hypothetical protein CE91St28_15100 [Pyramidobacter piscolens]
MKLDLRKKRFLISIGLLLCGVFALYPYLVSNPGRDLLKSVSRLDKPLPASVMTSIALGQALVEKGREQAVVSGHEQAIAALTDKIGVNVENLKRELLAMPPHSTQLSPGARAAYETLEAQLRGFIVSLAESGK